MRRLATIAILTGLCLCNSLAADTVWVRGIEYSKARVMEVNDKSLKFAFQGRVMVKSLRDVTRIKWEGHDDLNFAEQLFSRKKLKRARLAYEELRPNAADEEKPLIDFRLAACRDPKITKRPSKEPAEQRCYWCNNTGLMLCDHCKGSGKDLCDSCGGGGYETCPSCKGNWMRDCPHCGGDGDLGSYSVYENGRYRTRERDCPHCRNGKIECQRCKLSAIRGKVKCPKCHGTGRRGICPKCDGEKKLPCTHCEHGKKHADKHKLLLAAIGEAKDGEDSAAAESGSSDDASDRDAPAVPRTDADGMTVVDLHNPTITLPGKPPKAPAVTVDPDKPLSNPESLLAAMKRAPTHPSSDAAGWDEMTTLQKMKAQQEYQKELAAWQKKRKGFEGEEVTWDLKVRDIAPDAEGKTFKLVAISARWHEITATLGAADKKALVKLTKGDRVTVTGKLAAFEIEDPADAGALFSDDSDLQLVASLTDARLGKPE